MTKKNKNELESVESSKFYRVDENGDAYELDFDDIVQKFIEKTQKTVSEAHDALTPAEEPYYAETSQTKMDGSTAMMEARISKCQEHRGGSREACAEEVKAKMKNEGSENTNTKDTVTEDAKVEETTERVDVCKKEYDFLKAQSEELKKLKEEKAALDAEKKDMKADMDKVLDMFEKIKAEREAELEEKRQAKIDQLSADFYIDREELANDTMEDLLKTERRLGLSLKREEPKKNALDMDDPYDEMDKATKDMKGRYYMEV